MILRTDESEDNSNSARGVVWEGLNESSNVTNDTV